MSSGKQKRDKLKQKRLKRLTKRSKAKQGQRHKPLSDKALTAKLKVNPDALAPSNSYSVPLFVERGYYEDMPFVCKDCGAQQVWRDTQQKWWYEVMKGDIWTIAVRCRPCRRRERDRKTAARQIHLAGVAAKLAAQNATE